MKALKLRNRAVAAVTLYSFTLTTIAPSLAWAAEHEEPAPASAAVGATSRVSPSEAGATKFTDAVSTKDVATTVEKANVKAEAASTETADISKAKPSKQDLQKATGGALEKPADKPPEEQKGEQVEQALPTGGDKSGVTSQAISVPKGEGKIQGMGESFSAQLSTGIATFSVPFSLPGARGGAQPSLGLEYSSASGSGLAGMGWSVGVPYIARQTDRGLPQYDDRATWHPNQDRFVFNGGQELVPICTVAGGACAGMLEDEVMPTWASGYQYFRPRVEGSFLRFFWSPDHRTWRIQDKSGVTMELGVPLDGGANADTNGLETDPNDSTHIFRWHLARQYDPYCGGTTNCDTVAAPKPLNVVIYKYSQDSGQAYLSDIYDTTPAATPTDTSNLGKLAHHTHLNYEPRPDPTETYHSGWLIRQTKRLTGVDVASKTFGGAPDARRQVRRYHLEYDAGYHTSYLATVQVEGRCGGSETDAVVPAEANGLLPASTGCDTLPPMTFGYSHTEGYSTSGARNSSRLAGYEEIDARLKQVGGSPPHSIDEELTDYFDINSDGLPDILVTAPGVYGNDYGVFFNSSGGIRDTFGAVSQMGVNGVLGANSGSIKLSNANVAPLDADGDGIIDLLHMPKVKTYSVYHPKLHDTKWMLDGETIPVANKQSPKVDLGKDASETHVLDVNFDGLVDVVVSKGTEFETFFALGRLPNGHMQFGNGKWASKDTSTLSNDPIAKCVPYSGTPVRFSDSDIQLADMNGDGIQDIVRVRRGDLRYWPGRGNGFWGTGKLDDCPAGTFGDKRYVTMDTSPYYSDIQGTSLRLDDVNGDGLDDLVQVRFDAVDVYINVDGHGWTERFIIDKTPPSASYANRVRLVDLNGSGTRDIAWGDGRKYQYMDLAGGEQPGLLVLVKNGLGKSTDIEYSTSTEEMLAAQRSGVKCEREPCPFESPWLSTAPTVTRLVKRVTEHDNLASLGLPSGDYTTEYSYRDPLYEGRQREFRGFRRARSKRIGDENSPSDFTESAFLLGECEDETVGANDNGVDDCSLEERWRDNPREALKGLPVVTERYDEQGLKLSTALTTYRLRQLYLGRDGRAVRHAFQSSSKSVAYDTAIGPVPNSPASSFSAVYLERSYPVTPEGQHAVSYALAGGTGSAITEGATEVDGFGNATKSIDFGCTGGGACATPDEAINKFTTPKLLGSWMWRTERSYVTGSVQQAERGDTSTIFDEFGAPKSATAVLSGTVALDRFHETASRNNASGVALAAPNASTNGTISVGTTTYDAFGNVTEQTGPGGSGRPDLGRFRRVTYDSGDGYAQLPLSEAIHTRGPDVGEPLVTHANGYDRGMGLVTLVEDLNGHESTVKYDSFGRVTEVYRPRARALDLSQSPPTPLPAPLQSVKIEYSLPSVADPRAYSIIHTMAQDGEKEADPDYLESYSFVDGMGRARVGLSEADPDEEAGHRWIVSSVAEFDTKGAVRRKYLPFYLEGNSTSFPLRGLPATQYGRQRYDAFGRQVQTFDIDGTVTLQSSYHALSTDLWDAADLYPGPHQGSYASTRTDGHGRTVETTERVHEGNAMDSRFVRTAYLPTGEPTSISRERTGYPTVKRWMRYDTLGRLVLNVDPHTTGNFTIDETVSATPQPTVGLKAWRYAYNDAGELVGTSDARGCGQNFYYDGAGRLYGEDYSPCIKEHALYTNPSITSTPYDVSSLTPANRDALEVFYQFDSVPTAPVAAPAAADGYDSTRDAMNLKGKLVAVHDRAATTRFAYDDRGRTTTTWRKVSYIDAPQTTIAGRYVNRWYHQNFYYDSADRPVEQTTGASSPELQATTGLSGTDNKSAVRTHFTKRGTIKDVDSSYGKLVKHLKRDAEGKVVEMTVGDASETTTATRYDSRRRLASVQTFRQQANLWSTAPPSISPAPTAEDIERTHQLLLQDLDYSYDVVGNPTEIRDWRTPEEWPDGSKPVTRRMEYDDLNRVTRVDYEYPKGFDKFVSPFAAEIAGQNDPRRATPRGHKILSKRPLWQTYKYDWLGNTSQTDDDQHVFYERSLGTITSNAATSRPYQIAGASQSVSGGLQNGSLSGGVSYDAAGNVTYFRTGQNSTACATALSTCNSRFWYVWDEVGRLTNASRVEGEGPNSSGPYLDYLYDASDERVIKQSYFRSVGGALSPKLSTLYIFDSLEVRRAPFDSVTKQYTVDSTDEVAYLSAHGMRLARLVFEPLGKGEPQLVSSDALHARNLHIFLQLPDHLGSESLTIDHATGELVEARTHQPFGATESDYRPERWKGFREDYGFTGKEEDVEVGLQYFGKRYLSPYLGRWLSADPLAVHEPGKADLNLYAYVRGQILRAVDPIGLECGKDQTCPSDTGQDEKLQSGTEKTKSVEPPPTPAPAPTPAPTKAPTKKGQLTGYPDALRESVAKAMAKPSCRKNGACLYAGGISMLTAQAIAFPGDLANTANTALRGVEAAKDGDVVTASLDGLQVVGNVLYVGGAASTLARTVASTSKVVSETAVVTKSVSASDPVLATVLDSAGLSAPAGAPLALPHITGDASDLIVLGRQADTAVAANWPGHKVLNINNWSLARNDNFIATAIERGQNAYLASPINQSTLVQQTGQYAGTPTVFARELDQLSRAGYVQVGDYLLHPSFGSPTP